MTGSRMSTAPLLELRSLASAYGGVGVLSGISLAVNEGDVLGILGRNGAGKTTLLHSILNIGPEVSGDITLRGKSLRGLAPHTIARHGLALVPQGRGIFPTLTVEENLRLGLLGAPREKRDQRWTLASIYETFPRLGERRRASSSTLSGGERQMLALARALLTQADILMLDEPSEGLAPMVIEDVVAGLLRRLAERGVTILLVEQNMQLATSLATRIALLSSGRLVFDGPTTDFLARPELVHAHLGV